MSRRPARATQADIARAIRAAKQEKKAMAVEIAPDGTIRLIPVEIFGRGEEMVERKEGIVL